MMSLTGWCCTQLSVWLRCTVHTCSGAVVGWSGVLLATHCVAAEAVHHLFAWPCYAVHSYATAGPSRLCLHLQLRCVCSLEREILKEIYFLILPSTLQNAFNLEFRVFSLKMKYFN